MRIAIGGDFAMNDGLRALGRSWLGGGPAPGLDALRDLCAAVDLAVVDFEASIPCGTDPPDPSKVLIHADPGSIAVARALGIGAVTLANNHSFDFGPGTREALEGGGIACFGGGGDAARAATPFLPSGRAAGLACVGWADRSTIAGIWAGERTPGACATTPDALLAQVRELARAVEHVIVLPHWGWDYIRYPSPEMRDLGRRLVEAGAAAVIGTHPHVIGCSESHLGRPIVYSTGSLLLDDIRRPDGTLVVAYRPCVSLVAILSLGSGGVGIDFATFCCARGTFRALPPARGRALLERNDRFLDAADYPARYARHVARMRSFGLRLRNDVLGRPGFAAVRLARRLRRRGVR
jgi:poly-gamma-glutamate synthesis protein (capsule biosynthesis protein)